MKYESYAEYLKKGEIESTVSGIITGRVKEILKKWAKWTVSRKFSFTHNTDDRRHIKISGPSHGVKSLVEELCNNHGFEEVV